MLSPVGVVSLCGRRVTPGLAVRRALATSSVDAAEVSKFGKQASLWWNQSDGPFAALHSMNSVRVPLVTSVAPSCHAEPAPASSPLANLSVLDVGCGGGILAEALARLGGAVTGIDAAADNIAVATQHAADTWSADSPPPEYQCTTAEELVETGAKFDIVVSSEVIEHVVDPRAFVASCVRLTRAGGGLAFTTINRTPASAVGAIAVAEHMLGLLPPGTHSWSKFVTPEELKQYLLAAHPSVVIDRTVGFAYDPVFSGRWLTTGGVTPINYGVTALLE